MTDVSEEYGKDFKSLLMYFETCIVDKLGKVEAQRMNEEDFALAKQMKAEGLIQFERLKMRTLTSTLKHYDPAFTYTTHWVRFSDKAWELAHKFRRERAQIWIDREIEKDQTYIREQ